MTVQLWDPEALITKSGFLRNDIIGTGLRPLKQKHYNPWFQLYNLWYGLKLRSRYHRTRILNLVPIINNLSFIIIAPIAMVTPQQALRPFGFAQGDSAGARSKNE
ncbi:hypothetical protein ACR1PO_20910 [Chryseobacterium sp. RRHN12]|uniref:hypothetical protein n=1 Tax=Chryseobacterium sp. RRHN12 TaxID=3437884 RepID=UPI003D9B3EE0